MQKFSSGSILLLLLRLKVGIFIVDTAKCSQCKVIYVHSIHQLQKAPPVAGRALWCRIAHWALLRKAKLEVAAIILTIHFFLQSLRTYSSGGYIPCHKTSWMEFGVSESCLLQSSETAHFVGPLYWTPSQSHSPQSGYVGICWPGLVVASLHDSHGQGRLPSRRLTGQVSEEPFSVRIYLYKI